MGLGALYLRDTLYTREEEYVQIPRGQTGRLYRRLLIVTSSFSFCSMITVPPNFSLGT